MKRKKKKQKDLVRFRRFSRQDLKRLSEQAHGAWIVRNKKYYAGRCFKIGDWVRFRTEIPEEPGSYSKSWGKQKYLSVRQDPNGDILIGRVRVAFVQKTGRIQRYHLKYIDINTGRQEATTRGINQVTAASPEEISSINMLCDIKGYPKLDNSYDLQLSDIVTTVTSDGLTVKTLRII